jgi:predicted membrane channel-forming protein YqfA (hemolysin III family)
MTLLLRAIALVSGFFAAVFLVTPLLAITAGRSPARDTLASLVFLMLAALGGRSSRWLWRKKRFWTERVSFSEVCAWGVALVVWPIAASMEGGASQLMKDAIHIAVVAAVVVAYMVGRQYGLKLKSQRGEA